DYYCSSYTGTNSLF
nr:immunoglobulin light chain junction region [Macaca mulatta]